MTLYCNKNIPIYIDSDIGTELTGQDFAKELYEGGFINIYLSTGFPADHFKEMPWIKAVVGKAPPF